MTEFVGDDLKKLYAIPPLNKAVTFFGSARLAPNTFYYEQAKKLAFMCVQAGFSVVTGGGGGIMQAANEGAFKAAELLDINLNAKNSAKNLNFTPNSSENSQQISPQNPSPKDLKSIGFNIFLPFEQKGNDFLGYNITFKSLAIRKMALVEKSLAFVIFPGGFGTLDEFVEVLTLKQLGFKDVPIFVVGREFWRGFDEFIKSSLLSLNVISQGDELKYEITDDLEFIVKKLKEEYENSSRNEWRG